MDSAVKSIGRFIVKPDVLVYRAAFPVICSVLRLEHGVDSN